MMRFNRKEHKYEDYEVPKDWHCPIYTPYFDEVINCCQCGKELKVEQTYTSLEVHNHIGLGYMVCPECYEEEWKRKKEEENDNIKAS